MPSTPAKIHCPEFCRAQGWGVGQRLVGDEGYGPTVVEITAIGERNILAKTIRGVDGNSRPESTWSLRYRDWQPVEQKEADQ